MEDVDDDEIDYKFVKTKPEVADDSIWEKDDEELWQIPTKLTPQNLKSLETWDYKSIDNARDLGILLDDEDGVSITILVFLSI
ncbi:hypothetical protein L2E82_22434 [Cichorium intybus]|uniref:Uncharacterized protein n=1 Tax=Cichorium intybus TaxID=13427 RepID=A0ACB9DXY7_CICIN|nr:hypothetical protein L2E82_22434 [Cichorium intybus]